MSEEELIELQSYLDQELTPDEATRFEAKLATRPDLQAELERWESLFGSMTRLSLEATPQLSFNISSAVLDQIEARENRIAWRPWVIVQLILSALVLSVGWPWLMSVAPVSDRPSFDLGAILGDQLNRWWVQWLMVEQQIESVTTLLTDFDPDFTVSLAVLIPIALATGFIWAMSTRFLLRSDDWKPSKNMLTG